MPLRPTAALFCPLGQFKPLPRQILVSPLGLRITRGSGQLGALLGFRSMVFGSRRHSVTPWVISSTNGAANGQLLARAAEAATTSLSHRDASMTSLVLLLWR